MPDRIKDFTLTRSRVLATATLVLLLASPAAWAQSHHMWEKPGARIVFLGDSITYAGGFIAVLDAHLQASEIPPDELPELINVGLQSETCCGLSEPAHPFPRPDVHERLARVLEKTKPEVVVACYGMNDAIYYPFSEERFAKYQAGVRKIIATCEEAGVKVVLLTPPPFDPQPLDKRDKLYPPTADEFSWEHPSNDYDRVIKRYADWVMTLRNDVDFVIDVHTPVVKYVENKRKTAPDFALSSDGVHVEAEGHRVLADVVLKQFGVTPQEIDPQLLKLCQKRLDLLRDAWLTEIGHQRPNVPQGLPLADAETQADEIGQQIRAL